MVLKALRIAAPAAIAAALLARAATGAFAADAVGMTNVSGAVGDCSAPGGASAACATLFTGNARMWPGQQPEVATVSIAYHGAGQTRVFGVYLSKFASRDPRSGPVCSAPDPADKLNLTIRQAGQTVYQGTLSDFGRTHQGPATALPLRGGQGGSGQPGRWSNGDASSFTIEVGLDISADNPYMSCVSAADIAWVAQ